MKLPEHRHYRRIDVRLAPYPSYPYMLLGTTGDALLMKLMRHTAKKKGWCLNEFGMGEKVSDPSSSSYTAVRRSSWCVALF